MTAISAQGRTIPRPEFIALLAALMALNALAIDIMLPAFPQMGEALNVTNENDRQLVVSSYLFGFGVMQLVFGPLSDRFGRRIPLLFGLAVYILAAFAALATPNFATLLALRFVQGLGAAGTRVIAQSAVRDCYSGRAMAEIMSLIFMVFMVVPIIAPAVGQLILIYGHWTGIFAFIGGLCLMVALWAYFRLPETLAPENRRPLTPAGIFEGFAIVLSNRVSMSYALAGTLMLGSLFSFINTTQQIYVDIYGLGPLFPLAFAGTAGVMAVASYLNSRVVMTFGMRRLSHLAVLVFTALTTFLWLLSLGGVVPIWAFFVIFSAIMFMFGWAASNMNSLSMEPLGHVAGTASSAFGFIQTIGGAAIGLYVGRQFDGTITPIVGSLAILGTAALIIILFAERGRLFGTGVAPTEKSDRKNL